MRRLREVATRGFESISHTIRTQPDYNSEIDDTYLDALEADVRAKTPANFSLVPISEPGW